MPEVRWVWIAVLTVAGLLLAACDSTSSGFCSAAGCTSGAAVVVPVDLVAEVAYEVELCVDGTCHREVLEVPPPADGPVSGVSVGALSLDVDRDVVGIALGEGDWSGTHTVSATVLHGSTVLFETEDELEFAAVRPNGPDCPTTCWFAELRA